MQPVDGYVKRNSFTPMDDEEDGSNAVDTKTVTGTSPIQSHTTMTNDDKAAIAEEEKEDNDTNANQTENNSVTTDSILDVDRSGSSASNSSSGSDRDNQGKQSPTQDDRGRSPTFNTDAVSVASEAMSLPESERNLIPSPQLQNHQHHKQPSTTTSEHEAYEQYLAQQAMVHHHQQQQQQQQQMMLPSPQNGYPNYLPPTAIMQGGRKTSAPQMTMMHPPQQRSPNALSTSPNGGYNNQMFFNTMQPRTNNQKNLLPPNNRRKISAQSNASHATSRFGPPSPTRQQPQQQHQRQRSPNRVNNHGGNLGQQQYNYTDSRGRPLSMTDLRILEEVSRNPGYDRRRARSVEDLLSYDDGGVSEISMGSGGYATGRKKRPGMWASSQART